MHLQDNKVAGLQRCMQPTSVTRMASMLCIISAQ